MNLKRRVFDWLYAALDRLLDLLVDGRTPTVVRMKAIKPEARQVPVQHAGGKHLARESISHHCDIPPWGTQGGSYYCPLCRTWRVYQTLPLPRAEATEPHYVPRIRGRRNGHLHYTGGLVVDSGKLVLPGGRAW